MLPKTNNNNELNQIMANEIIMIIIIHIIIIGDFVLLLRVHTVCITHYFFSRESGIRYYFVGKLLFTVFRYAARCFDFDKYAETKCRIYSATVFDTRRNNNM